MGLSIHYQGKFKRSASLVKMIDEVKDIAVAHHWHYQVFKDEFPNKVGRSLIKTGLFGICFTPPKCETVFLTFLSNRKICSPIHFEFDFGEGWPNSDNGVGSPLVAVKTQFAGVETHKIIIDLLAYLNERYFHEFMLFDDSSYWESGNEEILRQKFREHEQMFGTFSKMLQEKGIQHETGVSLDDIIKGHEDE